jgi:hypothetical protein
VFEPVLSSDVDMMEARVIEYPRSNSLDYHLNSPLIGEIPTSDYTHFHRSIDQLRSLNERGILNANNFQHVLLPASTSPIVVQSSIYSEIKVSDDYRTSNKLLRHNNEDIMVTEDNNDDQKESDCEYRIIHSSQQYSIPTASISPQSLQNSFVTLENPPQVENQMKAKVQEGLFWG